MLQQLLLCVRHPQLSKTRVELRETKTKGSMGKTRIKKKKIGPSSTGEVIAKLAMLRTMLQLLVTQKRHQLEVQVQLQLLVSRPREVRPALFLQLQPPVLTAARSASGDLTRTKRRKRLRLRP